jgi:hypothetical protein
MPLRNLTIPALALVLPLFGSCGGGTPAAPGDPEATVEFFARGINENNPAVIWACLPDSYKKDLQGLVDRFARKMDAGLYNQGFALLEKTVGILRNQKDFILSSEMIQQGGLVPKGELEANYDKVVAMVATLADSRLARLENLEGIDIGAFLEGTGADLMDQFDAMKGMMPEEEFKEFKKPFRDIRTKVLKTGDDGRVKLEVTMADGGKDRIEMVEVEGKWIPTDMAEDWKDQMKDALEEVDSLQDKDVKEGMKRTREMLESVDKALDGLAAAESQEDFDKAMAGLMMPFMGSMMKGMGRRR